ncbi:MAG: TRAP transporter substrate-binding protein DctP [Deltaproteobacteria bacterium]|nr:TRAP transporter substrate-binding protein DctP [Deltaproteobacteria bacterium]
MRTVTKLIVSVFVVGLAFITIKVSSIWGQAAPKKIKMATIAPAGSSWDKITNDLNTELQQKTGGKLALQVYPGGTQGDETAVVRKIRAGQLDAAGFTGFGLGQIAPSVIVLEIPFLFKDAADIDARTSKITPTLEKALSAGNPPVELLGWAEAGFVYMMSNKPIAKLADLKGIKMWMWEGDPLAEAMFSAMNVTPIQLSIADVLTSLKTKMIEGVYAPPMGAVALQWASNVKYITDMPLVNSIGALVVSKAAFSKLPPDQQKILKEVAAKYCRQIIEQTRKDNDAAMASLLKLGVQKVTVADADRAEMMKISKDVGQKLVGKLYSQELLSMVQP